jgi:hypothetical protein
LGVFYVKSKLSRSLERRALTDSDLEAYWRKSTAVQIIGIPVLAASLVLLNSGFADSPRSSVQNWLVMSSVFTVMMIGLTHSAWQIYQGWETYKRTPDGQHFIAHMELRQNLRPTKERFGENGSVRID